MKFNTKVIHAGIEPDPTTGAIMTPIFQTSTYVQNAPGDHKGYEYARTQNPTRDVLQANLAALENGKHGICFASGLAATDAIMKMLKPGDEVLSTNDLYGGTYRLMRRIYEPFGIRFNFIGMEKPKEIKKHISENTKLLWIETPTNPMLNIIHIKKVCEAVKEVNKDILVVVDNTFASPYLQTPLDLGADIVCHSATKYLGGHSDVILGAVITNDEAIAKQLYFIQNASGAVPGPQDCFLILRGIKTLHLRVQRACENAERIVEFLKKQDKIANIYYPGLKNHPNHKVAKKQMRYFGGMVSFDFKNNTLETATKILENTHYFSLAESLGGVESLIGHPASMTHASIPWEERQKVGLTDSLIRLSVGVEDVRDLIEDLEKAFALINDAAPTVETPINEVDAVIAELTSELESVEV
jgi:cystathionine gamma-lyase